MRKCLLLALLLCHFAASYGQLTIEECYRLAEENYPLSVRSSLIDLTEEYNLANASKGYLPQFSLSGRATYQTDVTSIPIAVPGFDIPTLSKDQYQIVGEISQVIWDGGNIRAAKEAIRSQAEVDRAQHRVDMYDLRSRINDIFFGILLLDEQLRINLLLTEDLGVNRMRIESYVENGVANQSDLDAVRVEELSAAQSRTQLLSAREAYRIMLSAFIGRPVKGNTELVKPEIFPCPYDRSHIARPEMELFDAMAERNNTRKQSLRASNMPTVGLFVQGGYGKPGLNMLSDKFKTYAIGGVQLSWRLGGYYTRRNEVRKIEVDNRQVNVQRNVFLFNNDLQHTHLRQEYRKYESLMRTDQDIIEMRHNIVVASQAKFDNGTISATDLVRDVLAEKNARVNKAVHEIEMLQTVYGLKVLINN